MFILASLEMKISPDVQVLQIWKVKNGCVVVDWLVMSPCSPRLSPTEAKQSWAWLVPGWETP